DAPDPCRAFAAETERILHRSAAILAVAESVTAPELDEPRRRGHRAQLGLYRAFATAAQAPNPDHAADVLFAIASATLYLRFRTHRGWSGARYVDWLTETVRSTLA